MIDDDDKGPKGSSGGYEERWSFALENVKSQAFTRHCSFTLKHPHKDC